ncbi:MAG: SH3 domain-containing protein [Calditrichaeota bacterium]|nr:MAG: SH3 domain-containing protein [Calditrichota bacterium]MBL1206088.1 SH3 domain-containing protein [Calditrichota bacterium]NOG45914.1 SH3 domain-containing protein [Calditrichota bacterium]
MFRYFVLIFALILVISSCQPTVKKTPETSTIVLKKTYTAYVVRDKINMRQEATTSSAKVISVNNGDEVEVLQNKNGWYEVKTAEDQHGWIRSDFVGTQSLSYSRLVTDFVESTMADYKTELFIDENNPYAVIYLVLPETYYDDKTEARSLAQKIGRKYQDAVYPGTVEIRIMKKDKKKLFTRKTLTPIGPVGLKAPFLRHGRLYAFDRINGNEIKIKVLVPANLKENDLLEMSEEISSRYGDNITKIEIYFVENSGEGMLYLSKEDYTPSNKKVCRFYYIEDSQGPDYKANFCE